jgi:hypothetical protein
MSERACPICGGYEIRSYLPHTQDTAVVECGSCGRFQISGLMESMLPAAIRQNPKLRELLPKWIKRIHTMGPRINSVAIQEILDV